jgi:hypothetical protein
MASGTRRDAGPSTPAEDVSITWHRSEAADQVVLGAAAGGVRLAVAFPADADHPDLEAVLAERDRELEHFFDARSDHE